MRADRLLDVGHCSKKCGCCERARGFKAPPGFGEVEGQDETSKFWRRIDKNQQ
jgi:hypothetical protein